MKEALKDTQIKDVVQKLVKQRTIQLVDKESNEAVLQQEMSLIGD